MPYYKLYTYSCTNDIKRIQNQEEIISFIFQETQELLQSSPDITLDISSLVNYLKVHKNDTQPALINLKEITNDTKVIIDAELANEAINLFPSLFNEFESYFPDETEISSSNKHVNTLKQRNIITIYTYPNALYLNKIIEYADNNNIPIKTFSELIANDDVLNHSSKLFLLDLTSVMNTIENNKNFIYHIETYLNKFSDITFISSEAKADEILEYFPIYISKKEPIKNLINDLPEVAQNKINNIHTDVKKVTALKEMEFITFMDGFTNSLIGHDNFKEKLGYYISNFIALNNLKEKSVLSIFLFGESGIGKTEVARLIATNLINDTYLAKINFGNYSSKDALNSLIGSPAGYIGCEHGELSDKIKKSKVGVILCDEFEKTNKPVFSFFLELLEDGKFTDSMAREYDLDGYIIVFTSNLKNENEYNSTIPQELQTRFDLVCEFEGPTHQNKIDFIELQLSKARNKFESHFTKIKATESDYHNLKNFDYENIRSLRDIKKIFQNRLIDFLKSKQTIS